MPWRSPSLSSLSPENETRPASRARTTWSASSRRVNVPSAVRSITSGQHGAREVLVGGRDRVVDVRRRREPETRVRGARVPAGAPATRRPSPSTGSSRSRTGARSRRRRSRRAGALVAAASAVAESVDSRSSNQSADERPGLGLDRRQLLVDVLERLLGLAPAVAEQQHAPALRASELERVMEAREPRVAPITPSRSSTSRSARIHTARAVGEVGERLEGRDAGELRLEGLFGRGREPEDGLDGGAERRRAGGGAWRSIRGGRKGTVSPRRSLRIPSTAGEPGRSSVLAPEYYMLNTNRSAGALRWHSDESPVGRWRTPPPGERVKHA